MNEEIKRLLELAAKAAECKVDFQYKDFGIDSLYYPLECWQDGSVKEWWNPYYDDGDSRRLEVALGMLVEVDWEARSTTVILPPSQPGVKVVHTQRFADGSDGLAEVRLAVLRAAAAIGEAMP